MELNNPIVAYVAENNLEAHSFVEWLASNNVPAFVEEDVAGVGLYMFGTVSQFHKPKVWICKADLELATELLLKFEERKTARRRQIDSSPTILSECEECGAASEFPATQNGTTQSCPKCHAFMDVGEFDWPYESGLEEE